MDTKENTVLCGKAVMRSPRAGVWWRRGFVTASVSWASVLLLAPFAASRPNGDAIVFGFAYGAYAAGRIICHQLPARSFHLWSAPMPVCARCAGIYAGASIAAMFFAARPSQVQRVTADAIRARVVLVAAAVPIAATLLYEWITADTPAHWVRALTGVPAGAAVAWIIREVN